MTSFGSSFWGPISPYAALPNVLFDGRPTYGAHNARRILGIRSLIAETARFSVTWTVEHVRHSNHCY